MRLLLTLFLLIPLQASAFEYYTIKSGMTTEQLEVALDKMGAKLDNHWKKWVKRADGFDRLMAKPSSALLTLNHDHRLVKLEVRYRFKDSSEIKHIAFINALHKKFSAAKIEPEKKGATLTFTDTTLIESSIEHYESLYDSFLNNINPYETKDTGQIPLSYAPDK